jgi:hypothetical protein
MSPKQELHLIRSLFLPRRAREELWPITERTSSFSCKATWQTGYFTSTAAR